MMVDVRPLMDLNGRHTRRAVNLHSSDRWSRKRLQMGKVSRADLVTGKEGKRFVLISLIVARNPVDQQT